MTKIRTVVSSQRRLILSLGVVAALAIAVGFGHRLHAQDVPASPPAGTRRPRAAAQGTPTPDFPEANARRGATEKTMFPEVRTMHEMVGGGNNFVTEAGLRILREGGNAVDAGVAATLAAAVTEEDHFSMGGEMPLLIKMKGQPVQVVSGVGVAPMLATVDFYKNRPLEPWETPDRKPVIPAQGILSTTTPGMFDGVMLALQKYGTMSYAQVAAPAIELADAFPTTEIFATTLKNDESMLRRWPTSVKYFFIDDKLPVPGQVFKQPELAATMRAMVAAEAAAKGDRVKKIDAVRDYFYRGPVAKKMGAYSEANGGLVRYSDMAAFHAEIDTPRSTTFHGYEIVKPGFWTQGPVLLEMFNLLEKYDLKAMGHNSPEYLHTLVEAAKLAFADRDVFYGDPTSPRFPRPSCSRRPYAADRDKLIDPNHASMESRPGKIPATTSRCPPATSPRSTSRTPPASTSSTSSATSTPPHPPAPGSPRTWPATPASPTAAACNPSSPSPATPISSKAASARASPSAPRSSSRTVNPSLAISTPGADNQDQALLQVILNIIVFNMTPQAAVEAPRFQTEAFYSSFAMHEFIPGKLSLESRIPQATADKLTALGHIVTVTGPWTNASAPIAIKIDDDGVLEGGADPRRGRFINGD